MPGPSSLLEELFLTKPECIINFPERLLPQEKIGEYQDMSHLAMVEIAGRDSVAAAIKGVEENEFTDLIPTYAYTGTEYGPWSNMERAVRRLAEGLPHTRVHDPLVMGSPVFWQALNGRFISELISRYGFYTPCVGCHLYLHSVRIPLALSLQNIPIITGERERHNGDIKINQTSEALDFYQRMADLFNIELLMPLRHINEGKQIEEILGFEWHQGEEQLDCVLSGNYRMLNNKDVFKDQNVRGFLENFAVPCSKEIIESYVSGDIPDHISIAARILRGT
jgi:hypothetical protein